MLHIWPEKLGQEKRGKITWKLWKKSFFVFYLFTVHFSSGPTSESEYKTTNPDRKKKKKIWSGYDHWKKCWSIQVSPKSGSDIHVKKKVKPLKNHINSVCPGSSDPFYIVTYYIKWVTTSWTHSSLSDIHSHIKYCPKLRNLHVCRFYDFVPALYGHRVVGPEKWQGTSTMRGVGFHTSSELQVT